MPIPSQPDLAGTSVLARPRNPRCPGIGVYSPDPGQIGIPDFPKSGIPAKSGFKSGKIPIFLAAARTVIVHCQRIPNIFPTPPNRDRENSGYFPPAKSGRDGTGIRGLVLAGTGSAGSHRSARGRPGSQAARAALRARGLGSFRPGMIPPRSRRTPPSLVRSGRVITCLIKRGANRQGPPLGASA